MQNPVHVWDGRELIGAAATLLRTGLMNSPKRNLLLATVARHDGVAPTVRRLQRKSVSGRTADPGGRLCAGATGTLDAAELQHGRTTGWPCCCSLLMRRHRWLTANVHKTHPGRRIAFMTSRNEIRRLDKALRATGTWTRRSRAVRNTTMLTGRPSVDSTTSRTRS